MRIKLRLWIPALITGALLTVSSKSFAQVGSAGEAGCSLISERNPAQVVSYERIDRHQNTVTLRLRNNLNCAIVVETDDSYPSRPVPLLIDQKVEGVTDPQDRIVLALHYKVQNRKSGALRRAYGWGDSVFTYEILPGHSITFSVPLSHFNKRLDLAVPFNYSWETRSNGTARGVVHYVYFVADDLPIPVRGRNP